MGEQLIQAGKAYVCDLSARGGGPAPPADIKAGKESPFTATAASGTSTLFRRECGPGNSLNGARTLRRQQS